MCGDLCLKLRVLPEFGLFLFIFGNERLMFTLPAFVKKCWTLCDVFNYACFVNVPCHDYAWCAVSVVKPGGRTLGKKIIKVNRRRKGNIDIIWYLFFCSFDKTFQNFCFVMGLVRNAVNLSLSYHG